MCAPSPPPAPDYAQAARDQGAANLEATRAGAKLNNPNVVTPYGTQTVKYGDFDQAGYDAALAKYNTDLTAYNAQPLTSQPGARTWVADPNGGYVDGRGRGGPGMSAGQWVTAPATGIRPGTAPTAPTRAQSTTNQDQPTVTQTLSPEQQALYTQRTATQQQLGQVAGQGAQALQGVVGTPVDFSGAPQTGNYETTRQTVIDAMMGRANEDYTKRIDNDRSNLVAAGIPISSKAYQDNQQMTERSRNDARQQAEIAGGNAASQAYGMDADRRRQAITEMLAQRQTPLNEISALLSGSQVSNPFAAPGYAQNAQVAPAPIYGAANATGQYGTDVYNSQAAQAGNTQSGLVGLGGTALMAAAMF
jgi:hypothetical protein